MIGRKVSERYQIEHEIGRGGRGVVYRARDLRLEREVAVKCLRSDLHEDDAYERFRREALIVAGLDHPAIVPVYDFGRHDEEAYLVMALAPGRDLRRWMGETKLGPSDLIEIALPIVDALAFSHEQGVVHRDIKPENILVERRGANWRSRLLDFGIAIDLGRERLTSSSAFVGTPHYLSPEQLREEPIDGRSDLYALGAVLYEAVTGQPVHTGHLTTILRKVLDEEPKSPRELGAEIPADFEALILRCLAKRRAERPADAFELAASLRRLRDGSREPTRELTPEPAVRAERSCLGRRAELRGIERQLDQLDEGRCRLLVIAGEEGIGKTTLLYALADRARARGARVLRGRFLERSERAFPYHGYFEALLEYFDRRARRQDETPPDFSDLAGPLVQLFPALGDRPALRRAPGLPFPALRQWLGGRGRIFEILAKTFARITDGEPLVLLLEDLHEADVSIEALRYLLRRLGPLPILFAVTCRTPPPADHRPLRDLLESAEADADSCRVLRPGPLSREALAEMARRRLARPPGRALVDDLHATTGGHPLFATEMLRILSDEILTGETLTGETPADKTERDESLRLVSLPASLYQALDRRITGLAPEDRAALEIAAILGQSFDAADLRALATGENVGDRLVDRGLLAREGDDRLSFTSRLLRERIDERIDPEARRTLHRRVARRLETRHAGHLDRVVFALAHHATLAGDDAPTIEYSLRAAGLSLASGSPVDAVELARQALERIDAADRPAPAQRRRALELLARGHLEAGHESEVVRLVDDAVEVRAASAELLLLGARAAWRDGRLETTREWLRRGLDKAKNGEMRAELEALRKQVEGRGGRAAPETRPDETPDRKDSREEDLERLGELLLVQGDYLAARELFATAHARRSTWSGVESEVRHRLRLAELADKLGDYPTALEHCEKAAELGPAPLQAALVEALAGRIRCTIGDLEEASRHVTRGFDHLASAGEGGSERRKAAEARLYRTRGNVWIGLGEARKALDHYRRSIELLEGSEDRWELSIALFNLAETHIELGENEQALERLEEAYLAKSAIGDRWGLAWVHHARARVRRRLGELERAERDARLGLEIASRIGDPKITARLHVELGRVRVARGDLDDAERHLLRGLRRAEDVRAEPEAKAAREALTALTALPVLTEAEPA